jgi:uncharacterized protein YggE
MTITVTPVQRALAIGGVAGAALIGAFALGSSQVSAAPAQPAGTAQAGTAQAGARTAALTAAAGAARITVTGTGNVTGTPNQLVLSMGVQVNGPSVGTALTLADAAVSRVTAALRDRGVAAADIQTAGLSIWPNYASSSPVPDGYAASESLTATLNSLATAGAQIDAAVHAGGNATTVSGISLNLTDTSSLLARARAGAVADATAKAAQYARALGEPLGPVVSVTDQSAAQPLPMFSGVSASAAAGKSVPISPGTQQLSVSVTVVFAA